MTISNVNARVLEEEFEESYGRFHEYMSKSVSLFNLYVEKKDLKIIKSWERAVPTANKCIIALLEIKDPKVLEVFTKYKNPGKTRLLAIEIEKNHIGGHLTSHITYMYWKYCHMVYRIKNMKQNLSNQVLLEQSIVTACTAYECYLKEMIPWILKNHEESRKRFLGGLDKPIKELGKYNFDLIRNVDAIYQENYGTKMMPVFPDLEKFYNDKFGINLFHSKKDRMDVEKIFQVRHCIIHNAGKPDNQWKIKMKNARFLIDKDNTKNYCIKIDEKLHDAAYSIFKLTLPDKKGPWSANKNKPKTHSCMMHKRGRWKYIEKSKSKKIS